MKKFYKQAFFAGLTTHIAILGIFALISPNWDLFLGGIIGSLGFAFVVYRNSETIN